MTDLLFVLGARPGPEYRAQPTGARALEPSGSNTAKTGKVMTRFALALEPRQVPGRLTGLALIPVKTR
jgi:hypothetical protein